LGECGGDDWGVDAIRQRKAFFFCKKEARDFFPAVGDSNDKSFLVLFLEKGLLASTCLDAAVYLNDRRVDKLLRHPPLSKVRVAIGGWRKRLSALQTTNPDLWDR
jgi:hypothetical protein